MQIETGARTQKSPEMVLLRVAAADFGFAATTQRSLESALLRVVCGILLRMQTAPTTQMRLESALLHVICGMLLRLSDSDRLCIDVGDSHFSGMAQELHRRQTSGDERLEFLRGYTIGETCHIVERAIQRKILAYENSLLLPVSACHSYFF